MNKEIIEKYINFGIDNGFNGIKYSQEVKSIGNELFDKLGLKYNLVELITSKEFIRAIALGLCKDFCVTENYDYVIKDKIKRIIIHQAKAIAEFEGDNLEEFINNLLK